MGQLLGNLVFICFEGEIPEGNSYIGFLENRPAVGPVGSLIHTSLRNTSSSCGENSSADCWISSPLSFSFQQSSLFRAQLNLPPALCSCGARPNFHSHSFWLGPLSGINLRYSSFYGNLQHQLYTYAHETKGKCVYVLFHSLKKVYSPRHEHAQPCSTPTIARAHISKRRDD